MNFSEEYNTELSTLKSEDVLNTRERIQGSMAEIDASIDTSPGTVVGDLAVTPMAFVNTAIDTNITEFMSDLLLENPSKGIVYSCNVVNAYLDNLTSSMLNLMSTGVIAMAFSESATYELQRGTTFNIGDATFEIYYPYAGNFIIGAVGSPIPPDTNGVELIDMGTGIFLAYIPIIGVTSKVIAAGTSVSIVSSIPEITSVVLVTDVKATETSLSIPDRVEMARRSRYSASMTTRIGAINYIKQYCPNIESVYASVSGDTTMIREFLDPFAMRQGFIDVYIRTGTYDFSMTQTIRMLYNKDDDTFSSDFNYVGQPYYIDAVTVGTKRLDYSVTATYDNQQSILAAYTEKERLSITVKNSYSPNGKSVIPTNLDATDKNTYALITVVYRTDYFLPSIAQSIMNRNNTPVNTSIQVRGFIPVIIRKFNVRYIKKNGAIPDLQAAVEEIKLYIAALNDTNTYSDAAIGEIMLNAGARYLQEIDVDAYVQWSVADKVQNVGNNSIDVLTKEPIIRSTADLRLSIPAQGAILDINRPFACSTKTVKYYLLDNALSFTELQE